jgi:hypothetical protein
MQFIGRVYKITAPETEAIYIGSTTSQLEKRFQQHKTAYKAYINNKGSYTSSFEIMKYAGANIGLIHEGLFNTKEELLHCEGNLISTTPSCINKHIAGNLLGNVNGHQQNYRHENRDVLRAKFVCDICGGKFTHANKSIHLKSKKHKLASSDSSEDDSEAE